jgi:hypothetical protein
MKFTTFRNSLFSVGALTAMGSVAYVMTHRAPPAPPPPRPPAQIALPAAPPPQATPPVPVAAALADTLREVDRVTLALLQGPARDKVKDATPGKPFKVNLYSDDGKRFNRAKVDLNRNDKWDEKWTVDASGALERTVAPADDEAYKETYVLKDTTWVRK